MSVDFQNLPLGKATAYADQYDASLLVAVPRAATRDFWPATQALPFCGEDSWTGYELSWLNNNGMPQIACALLQYDALSTAIVESKSLKLYFNSLNQTRFTSKDALANVIRSDLAHTVNADVTVTLLPAHTTRELAVQNWDTHCLDDLDIRIEHYTPDAALLRCEHTEKTEETVCSHLLRSNCPVTGQPDWASVRIHYCGARISHESLLRYICSFRLHQGFHEQCIERMFCDIWQHCQPERLSIEGRFTRRGGLDINPFRASHTDMHALHARQLRQ